MIVVRTAGTDIVCILAVDTPIIRVFVRNVNSRFVHEEVVIALLEAVDAIELIDPNLVADHDLLIGGVADGSVRLLFGVQRGPLEPVVPAVELRLRH